MKINQRGFTLIELLIFLGVLAVVGVWVATQGSNVLSGSKTERAYQQIDAIMKAAEEYRQQPNRRGSFTGISITSLVTEGYPLDPLTTGTNQNVYGMTVTIASSGNTNALLVYNTPGTQDCNQLDQRFTTSSKLASAPTCSGNNLQLLIE
jgi:prepilin-type N-terminal cleavage/methylation domain-containing protein